jgi:hypothetical protein
MRSWFYGLSALVLVPALASQESVVPLDTRFIGDRSGRYFVSVECASVDAIPHSNRSFFRTRSAAEAAGYREITCEQEQSAAAPPAAPPPVASESPRAPVAASESLPRRRGLWFSGGLGWGSLGCEDCSGREGGLSGGIQLGGSVSPKFLLGAGTTGWTRNEDGVTLTVGTVVALFRFYPSATGGFFLLGGLGLGTIHLAVDGFGSDTETGGGALLGLGYDIRIGESVSLSPFWNGFAARTSNADANVGQLGLSITLH